MDNMSALEQEQTAKHSRACGVFWRLLRLPLILRIDYIQCLRVRRLGVRIQLTVLEQPTGVRCNTEEDPLKDG